jgi:FKBP-type peptidyl-prolyl cis-trans isomerase FkpA
MKLKFPLIAAFVALLSLTACGGGSSSSNSGGVVAENAPAFSVTDTVVGTGPAVVAGQHVTVQYTGWLYSSSAADHKGMQFQTGTFPFTVGLTPPQAIQGFDQGVIGMKVGGKRTVIIPANLGYGSVGSDTIPPNSGLVFDIQLTSVP